MIAGISFAASTDVGKVRTNNEDSFIVLEGANSSYALILADGMGGHRRGELASSTAVKYVARNMSTSITDDMDYADIKIKLLKIVEKSNVKVFLKSLISTENRGMGTTLTVGFITNNHLMIGHIGDCRAYVLRANKLLQLTKDHSLVQALVDRGDLTKEEAINHKKKNVVTRALGSSEYVKADFFEFDLRKNDKLLFCSDGLHDYIEEKSIKKQLKDSKNPAEAVNALITLAVEGSGEDNVTVIVGFVN